MTGKLKVIFKKSHWRLKSHKIFYLMLFLIFPIGIFVGLNLNNVALFANSNKCSTISSEAVMYPESNNTSYKIIYSDKGKLIYKNNFDYPCKVSLVKNDVVIVDDLISVMLHEGFDPYKEGLPKPYIFYKEVKKDGSYVGNNLEEKLFFGRSYYEGQYSSVYKFNPNTLKFNEVIGPTFDSQPDRHFNLIVYGYGKYIRVLDLNTEEIYEFSPINSEDEVIYTCYYFDCLYSVGWLDLDGENIWYGLYKEQYEDKNSFIRTGSVKFDRNVWRTVSN